MSRKSTLDLGDPKVHVSRKKTVGVSPRKVGWAIFDVVGFRMHWVGLANGWGFGLEVQFVHNFFWERSKWLTTWKLLFQTPFKSVSTTELIELKQAQHTENTSRKFQVLCKRIIQHCANVCFADWLRIIGASHFVVPSKCLEEIDLWISNIFRATIAWRPLLLCSFWGTRKGQLWLVLATKKRQQKHMKLSMATIMQLISSLLHPYPMIHWLSCVPDGDRLDHHQQDKCFIDTWHAYPSRWP